MIYSKNGSPTGTLDHARDLSIENQIKANKSPIDSGVIPSQGASILPVKPTSICRWYHLPANNVSLSALPKGNFTNSTLHRCLGLRSG
jgi:hypothetical protein